MKKNIVAEREITKYANKKCELSYRLGKNIFHPPFKKDN